MRRGGSTELRSSILSGGAKRDGIRSAAILDFQNYPNRTVQSSRGGQSPTVKRIGITVTNEQK